MKKKPEAFLQKIRDINPQIKHLLLDVIEDKWIIKDKGFELHSEYREK